MALMLDKAMRSSRERCETASSCYHSRLFSLASSREALLLRPIVRTRFQFVVLTSVAVEVKDCLSVFGAHKASSSGIAYIQMPWRDLKPTIMETVGGGVGFVAGYPTQNPRFESAFI